MTIQIKDPHVVVKCRSCGTVDISVRKPRQIDYCEECGSSILEIEMRS